MMRMKRYVPLVLACLFLIAPAVAVAQETRGSIEGVVKDSTGGALPGVTVSVKQIATNAVVTAVTDATGVYRFPSLPPGPYIVSATLSGFSPQAMEKFDLIVGQIRRVNITMSVAGIAVSEVVHGETPLVDVKQNSVTQTVSKDLIALLPNSNRDFQSVLTGLPGINFETDISGSRASGVMIDGASQSENRFIIDGQDTTNLRTGLSGKGLVVDFIEQIQVKQSGYNAEFRATTGGVVSVITKSGTNAYHGAAAMDYNGKALNGAAWRHPPAASRRSERERRQRRSAVLHDAPHQRIRAVSRSSRSSTSAARSSRTSHGSTWAITSQVFNQDRTVAWSNPSRAG